MSQLIYLLQFIFAQTAVFILVAIVINVLIWSIAKRIYNRRIACFTVVVAILLTILVFVTYLIPGRVRTFGPSDGPAISIQNLYTFFTKFSSLEHVENIAQDPNQVPPLITRVTEDHVRISLQAQEVIAQLADGVEINYWTFNGTVPGPMLRVREGDTVELSLTNHATSINHHNIDLHAVTGPGGGATVTTVAPGETKSLTFKALNPGLYVYHCAHPNAATHMAHGMYGLILVEPKDGLSLVDKEFYIMQGEIYTTGQLGKSGLQIFDAQKMLDGGPSYVVFNGKVNGVVDNMELKKGERVRLYVGNGGVNLISSFHVIGEIFDTVYPEAAIGGSSSILHNVQTTTIPAGGATIVEFTVDVPGKYILVDHALARMDKGAWGTLQVDGEPDTTLFDGIVDPNTHGH